MSPSTQSALSGLLGAALAVAGVLYAQRVLRENKERWTREHQEQQAPAPMTADAAPDGRQGGAAPAPPQPAPAAQAQPAPAPPAGQ